MTETPGLDDLDFLLSERPRDARAAYDRAASRYEHFRDLWLKLAGGEAEAKMRAILNEVVLSEARILDAGAGTGAMSRVILAARESARLALLDQSLAMLSHAADVKGYRVGGDVGALPFADGTFEVVVSAWVIETLSDPAQAVGEYLRVLSTTGSLLYSFCSLPGGWFSRAGSFLLRKAVERGFAGKFLPPEEAPWHDCARSRRWRFHGGLTTLVLLRKCCSVGHGVLPVPMEEVPPAVV
ncbi:MAG: methyltransferase domain-containing protein [Acidobacteriota bacterium]